MPANGRLPEEQLAAIPGGRLRRDAAAAWNAMNEESVRRYGVTLRPVGPMSSYRTVAEQQILRKQWCAQGPHPMEVEDHTLLRAAPDERVVVSVIADTTPGGDGWRLRHGTCLVVPTACAAVSWREWSANQSVERESTASGGLDLPRFGGHGVVRRPWPLTLE